MVVGGVAMRASMSNAKEGTEGAATDDGAEAGDAAIKGEEEGVGKNAREEELTTEEVSETVDSPSTEEEEETELIEGGCQPGSGV